MMTRLGMIFGGVITLFFMLTIMSAYYVVDEGNVGIIKRQGAAVEMVNPGGHWKMPFIEAVDEVEVRERALVYEALYGTTNDRIPVTLRFSVNWAVDRASVLDMYRQYGGIDEFESRVLIRQIQQSAKDGLGQHPAIDLDTKRGEVANTILNKIVSATDDLPIIISSPNIENFELPESYARAIAESINARQAVLRAEEELKRQEVEVKQKVQQANADAQAEKARADAEAYTRQKEADSALYASLKAAEGQLATAKAEAEGKQLLADAITTNPALVQYEQATRWDGTLPRWIMGGEGGNVPIMLNMGVGSPE